MVMPSKYDPSYCEAVIEHCKDGSSITSFGASVGVSRTTITNWQHEFPKFGEAVQIAKAHAAAWWEERARLVVANGGTSAQSTLCMFGMKNMGREDWADRQEVEHSGKDGTPLGFKVTFGSADGG